MGLVFCAFDVRRACWLLTEADSLMFRGAAGKLSLL